MIRAAVFKSCHICQQVKRGASVPARRKKLCRRVLVNAADHTGGGRVHRPIGVHFEQLFHIPRKFGVLCRIYVIFCAAAVSGVSEDRSAGLHILIYLYVYRLDSAVIPADFERRVNIKLPAAYRFGIFVEYAYTLANGAPVLIYGDDGDAVFLALRVTGENGAVRGGDAHAAAYGDSVGFYIHREQSVKRQYGKRAMLKHNVAYAVADIRIKLHNAPGRGGSEEIHLARVCIERHLRFNILNIFLILIYRVHDAYPVNLGKRLTLGDKIAVVHEIFRHFNAVGELDLNGILIRERSGAGNGFAYVGKSRLRRQYACLIAGCILRAFKCEGYDHKRSGQKHSQDAEYVLFC